MNLKAITFIVLVFAINGVFAQSETKEASNFDFKLVEPSQTKISLNPTDEIPVKITFNADAVNDKAAWILAMVDGAKMRFIAATTMESPFESKIVAKKIGLGVHTIDYLLLPPGQNTDKPYAKISLEITVEGDTKKYAENKANIEAMVEQLVTSIKTNDTKTFTKLCVNKARMDVIVNGITGDTPKDKGVKADLESEDGAALQKKAIDSFNKLQAEAKAKNLDLSKLEFVGYEKNDVIFEMPNFMVMDVAFKILAGDKSYVIKLNVFTTEKDLFIFEFKDTDI